MLEVLRENWMPRLLNSVTRHCKPLSWKGKKLQLFLVPIPIASLLRRLTLQPEQSAKVWRVENKLLSDLIEST